MGGFVRSFCPKGFILTISLCSFFALILAIDHIYQQPDPEYCFPGTHPKCHTDQECVIICQKIGKATGVCTPTPPDLIEVCCCSFT
ncbi:unnamed protein product [Cuscuta campestris]|uniref:Uncharacterized protein n=1 Tax=Cuscuta campestris TaxID=132261 RepID=A0A484N3P8_9ASTE|nr:unnamed protein product [Cuscuta campestris]